MSSARRRLDESEKYHDPKGLRPVALLWEEPPPAPIRSEIVGRDAVARSSSAKVTTLSDR